MFLSGNQPHVGSSAQIAEADAEEAEAALDELRGALSAERAETKRLAAELTATKANLYSSFSFPAG